MKDKIEVFGPKFLKLVEEATSLGICGHVSPDGDCLGSVLALEEGLGQINNRVYGINNDELPDYLSFMPGIDAMTELEEIDSVDVMIVVDVSSLDRIGEAERLFNSAKETVVIDHHASNLYFGNHNLVVSDASSTCELVYELLKYLDFNISPAMATNLYTGLTTDSNRYMYETTYPRTLRTGADLLELGADKDLINKEIYQNNSLSSFKLTGVLADRAEFYYDNKLALGYVPDSVIKGLCGTDEDLEGKVELLRDIDGVEVAILIKDSEGVYKVSLRSKSYIDVSQLALSFGGGGHIRAAGFTYREGIAELRKDLMQRFDEIDWKTT